jgi:hypothetical protein
MAMHWYEGEITAYDDEIGGDSVHRATVRELTQGVEIRNVQMPLRSSQQDLPRVGSRIVFYRDTAATAKYAFLLSDPRPIGSPISIETAVKAAQDGEPVFNQGEVAMSALGDDDGFNSSEGGQLWLRNTGDAILASGSYQQRVMASDSTDSIDIQGTNINIYTQGNLIATHAINIDTQAFTGISTLGLGLMNPVTGVYVTRLQCDTFGAWTLGAEDPLLGSLVSGISYNLIPSLPLGPFIVPEIKLMSVPLLSQVTVNPLGTSINGATINIAGAAAITGVAAPAGVVNITSAVTQITGAVDILGAVGITGQTSIEGATSIVGATSITGLTTIAGLLSIGTLALPTVITPAPGALGAAGASMIPILVNGLPRFMLIL